MRIVYLVTYIYIYIYIYIIGSINICSKVRSTLCNNFTFALRASTKCLISFVYTGTIFAFKHSFYLLNSLDISGVTIKQANYFATSSSPAPPCYSGTSRLEQHSHGQGQDNRVMRRITTFRSTTERIYDGGPIMLYYNISLCYNCLQYSVQ